MDPLDTTNRVEIDEELAYKSLLRKLKGTTKYKRVVTCGRGGLSVAQRVAYLLDLTVYVTVYSGELKGLSTTDLFVDDISCTGTTIGQIPRNVDTAVLIQRKSTSHKATHVGFIFEGSEYIEFSWEK